MFRREVGTQTEGKHGQPTASWETKTRGTRKRVWVQLQERPCAFGAAWTARGWKRPRGPVALL